jgi:hypothetical protein
MTAVFSDCGLYRYRLDRDVDAPLLGPGGRVVFCCLNPSIAGRVLAGREIGDPSATRMEGFTRSWGFTSFSIVNVFALVSTDPAVLAGMDRAEAVGPENDAYIQSAAVWADLIVAAWGSSYPKALADRVAEVLAILRSAGPVYHLGLTGNGDPRHPLRLPGSTQPTLWEAA